MLVGSPILSTMLEENKQQPTPHGGDQSTPGSSDCLEMDDFNPEVLNPNHSRFYSTGIFTTINDLFPRSSNFGDQNLNAPPIVPERVSDHENEDVRHILPTEMAKQVHLRNMNMREEIAEKRRVLRKSRFEVSCAYQSQSMT